MDFYRARWAVLWLSCTVISDTSLRIGYNGERILIPTGLGILQHILVLLLLCPYVCEYLINLHHKRIFHSIILY